MKFVCEDCNNVFEVKEEKLSKIFNPDCPQCGSSNTTEPRWALDGEYDLEDAEPLENSLAEPAPAWRGLGRTLLVTTCAADTKAGPGRPPLPPEEKRKIRTIKMSDAEWEEIRRRAARKDISAAEYLRRKALSKGKEG